MTGGETSRALVRCFIALTVCFAVYMQSLLQINSHILFSLGVGICLPQQSVF